MKQRLLILWIFVTVMCVQAVAQMSIINVQLSDVNGEKHQLSDYKGKYVYVDLWASWCGPCNMEIPYLQELERTLDNDEVEFVAISIDEDVRSWKAALTRNKMTGHQFIAPSELPILLRLRSIPRYMILDKEGKVLYSNAPRPSSGAIIKKILSELK
ncbi:MAG: TlpA family protein disulfide reductase [Muribaculaceae bacterium]|nr:TlpA family protein disulfide reductase [Muribaculaceae bacterium]